MSSFESANPAWQQFWQAILEAPLPEVSPPVPQPDAFDDEFDFLADAPALAPAANVPTVLTPDPARVSRLASLEALLPDVVAVLRASPNALRDDARLDRVDPAGAIWILRALQQLPPTALPEHGPLVRLLQRSARSTDPLLVVLTADVTLQLDARAVQLDLVARLHADPQGLGHDGVDRVLACLKQIADGRCVREMEALLMDRGAQLSDVHAWQARHIVQVIRRGGRK